MGTGPQKTDTPKGRSRLTGWKTAAAAVLLLAAAALLFLCARHFRMPSGDARPSLDSCRLPDSPVIYDLTLAAQDLGAGRTPVCCAMYDPETLLLLYSDESDSDGPGPDGPDPDGPDPGGPDSDGSDPNGSSGPPRFSAVLLSLKDGSGSDPVSFDNVTGNTAFVEILSADPLIVYDSIGGIIYRPGGGASPLQASSLPASPLRAFSIPDRLSDAEPVVSGGELLLASRKGILWRVAEDGTLTELARLPYQCSYMIPRPALREGTAAFYTYPESEPDLQICAEYDLSAGEFGFFTIDNEEGYYSVGSGGYLASAFSDRRSLIRAWSLGQGMEYTLTLPESVTQYQNLGGFKDASAHGTDAGLLLHIGDCALAGEWCCFSLSDGNGYPDRIYLWDMGGKSEAAEAKQKELSRVPYPFPDTDYGELSERAEDILNKYDVTVVLGDNVPTVFPDYTVQCLDSRPAMERGLDILEAALALYPEGYFEALRSLYYREIVVYLTGAMKPRMSGLNIENAGAFTTDQNGVARIALNPETGLGTGTVVHELTHMTDYALLAAGLLPEEEWMSLNPPGFAYYGSYFDENGNSYAESPDTAYTMLDRDPENIYFADSYSKTFALEDRARLVEEFFTDAPGKTVAQAVLSGSAPHLGEKLAWYRNLLKRTLGMDFP